MNQYLKLLRDIKEKGVRKSPAREGMPGTTSIFGYQFRHNLQEGFPLLTTKKMFWKGVVVELLWFLRGDTNIKFLVDNGVNVWNEDAYNYYVNKMKQADISMLNGLRWHPMSIDEFIDETKAGTESSLPNYKFGDCGFQYGKTWRSWEKFTFETDSDGNDCSHRNTDIDQIANVIASLKNNPEGRRHIVTAWDPAHDQDLALTWCHAMFQFNTRSISENERKQLYKNKVGRECGDGVIAGDYVYYCDQENVPKYYLDCQMYQRSADAFLGVPFNIASYALLTHIIAKICNMVPGDFVHTFGDVHIYDNHIDQVEEQLRRSPDKLPILKIKDEGNDWAAISNLNFDLIEMLNYTDFQLENYHPQSAIKAELSTGLKK